jgi:hypothetical protein
LSQRTVRLVGATVVQDAADIVEAFVRHNLTLLDGLAIVDHGSSDGTTEILAALVAERLPVFVARDESPGFDQRGLTNSLVRHVFASSDAAWVFPLDSDEFLKADSRRALEAVLTRSSLCTHITLPWLTYVPRFSRSEEVVTVLRSARRVATQRHGYGKIAVGRHFLTAAGARVGMGSHAVEGLPSSDAGQDVNCKAEGVAIAHVPIRSSPQFFVKIAGGWLGMLASGKLQGGEAFHWREAYRRLQTGRPIDDAELNAFAMNYAVPREQWLSAADIELVDDPFLAEMELRYTRHGETDPLGLVLGVVERLVAAKRHD